MRLLPLTVLVTLVFASAVAVVQVKHRTRTLFVELQKLERTHDRMQVEWGRLQLEQSTWATHDRVINLAAKQLGLIEPKPGSVVLVTPR
ncbi:MAG: cell division protein FtsL [Gammaproteobacteria bacterium]|nr:MAG: cell division protein FtsL [Gammaproteobacteria bacterium]